MSNRAAANAINVKSIKEKLLRPALTSHYICSFQIPNTGFITSRASVNIQKTADLINLACFEASLPGSTLATHDINNDFTGVSEKHVYRRLYDDRADFSFYVDAKEYYVIKVFEAWMGYSVDEQYNSNKRGDIEGRTYNYRVNYPDLYCTDKISITKFERSTVTPQLTYTFVKAFPVSINSIQVSYDSSQLLKCTVSFAYSRYWVSGTQIPNNFSSNSTPPTNTEPRQSTPPGVPTPNTNNNFNLTPQQQASFNSQSFNFNQSPNLFNESAGTSFNNGDGTNGGTRQPIIWNSSYLGNDGTNGGTRQPRPWNRSNLRNPTPLF